MPQLPPLDPGLGPEDFASPFGEAPETLHGSGRPQSLANRWAITSLISGLLGCVPFVAGIVAIIAGIVGLRRANDPRYGGRPLAIGGLLLGVLSVFFWLFYGTAFFDPFLAAGEPRRVAQEFVRMASDGAIDNAIQRAAPTLARAELERLVSQIEAWGAFQDLASHSSAITVQAVISRYQFEGIATFADGEHPFTMTLQKLDNTWKVSAIKFE